MFASQKSRIARAGILVAALPATALLAGCVASGGSAVRGAAEQNMSDAVRSIQFAAHVPGVAVNNMSDAVRVARLDRSVPGVAAHSMSEAVRVAGLLASPTSNIPDAYGPQGPYGGGTYAPTSISGSAQTFYGPNGPYGGGTYAPTNASESQTVVTFRAGGRYEN